MRPLVIFVALIIAFPAAGQNGYALVDTTKEWNTLSMGISAFAVCSPGNTTRETIGNPTEINGQTYFPVYHNQITGNRTATPGYLREDTTSQKVYFYDLYEDEEGLLYDFSISEGDTVLVQNYFVDFEDVSMVCNDIDTTVIDGEPRKVFSFYYDTWIEGIGSLHGLLYSAHGSLPGGGHELTCCFKNGELVYDNDTYNSCVVTQFHPEITTEEYDTAYVNSYYEFQLQHSLVPAGDSTSWEAITLPAGLSLNEGSGLISGIPNQPGPQSATVVVINHRLGYRTDYLMKDIFIADATTNQNIAKENIKIYPNPAQGEFYISVEKPQNKIVKLYNAESKLLLSQKLSAKTTPVNCRNLPKGIYMLRITDEKQTFTQKRIVLQ
ncbi:MAG: T9SS type A sorting domain-containing protein [Bacteroidales bacterium]|nr:T9SS type A sorting domain-containing protein [Bacteroidales bacterium]